MTLQDLTIIQHGLNRHLFTFKAADLFAPERRENEMITAY